MKTRIEKCKKMMLYGLIVCAFGMVTGCGNGNNGQEVQNQPQSQTAQSAEPVQDTGTDTTSVSPAETIASQITEEQAKAAALEKVPGAGDKDIRIHLDMDDGRQIYEGSIVYDAMEYDFEIDASNGTFLEWEAESVYD